MDMRAVCVCKCAYLNQYSIRCSSQEFRQENLFPSMQWRKKMLLPVLAQSSICLWRDNLQLRKRGSRPVFFSEGTKCTKQSNNWATGNFEEWRRDYNGRNPGSEIRRDILGSMDCQELDEVLSTFIVETRKENGEKYPLCMLYQLLSVLHRYFTRMWTYLSFVLASYLLQSTNKSPGQFI